MGVEILSPLSVSIMYEEKTFAAPHNTACHPRQGRLHSLSTMALCQTVSGMWHGETCRLALAGHVVSGQSSDTKKIFRSGSDHNCKSGGPDIWSHPFPGRCHHSTNVLLNTLDSYLQSEELQLAPL
ncbi:hypothetical protein J6590_078834 [Homalodisca vitripennis]|nr:hypothetical protein J6590_078834 [Homalodisca vitripennis]